MHAPYFVEILHADSSLVLASKAPTLRRAKKYARTGWDIAPGRLVVITGTDGISIEASQPHGTGMLWR